MKRERRGYSTRSTHYSTPSPPLSFCPVASHPSLFTAAVRHINIIQRVQVIIFFSAKSTAAPGGAMLGQRENGTRIVRDLGAHVGKGEVQLCGSVQPPSLPLLPIPILPCSMCRSCGSCWRWLAWPPPSLPPSLIWLALIAAYENSFGVRTAAAAAPMGCVLAAVRLEREGGGWLAALHRMLERDRENCFQRKCRRCCGCGACGSVLIGRPNEAECFKFQGVLSVLCEWWSASKRCIFPSSLLPPLFLLCVSCSFIQ